MSKIHEDGEEPSLQDIGTNISATFQLCVRRTSYQPVQAPVEHWLSGLSAWLTCLLHCTRVFLRCLRRTLIAIVGGALAGILRLRGFHGVLFYFFVCGVTAIAILSKSSYKPSAYFRTTTMSTVLFSSAFSRSALLPYVVLWILFDALSSPYV